MEKNKKSKKTKENEELKKDTVKNSESNKETKSENEKLKKGTESKAEETKKNEENEKLIKELIDSNKKITEENSKIKNELVTFKDRLVSISAEYDNYRKRTAKEKEEIYTNSCNDILKEFFPVFDSLERAKDSNAKNIEDLKTGIDMTIRLFNDSLKKLDIEEIPVDKGFDPNFHNAIMHVEDDSYGKNEIVEVFQKGYKKGNKVLRHSMVKVAN